MKLKRLTGVIAVFICALFIFEAGAISAPVSAAENDDSATQPLVTVPNGYDKLDFSTLYTSEKLTASGDDTAKLTASETYGGLVIEGKTDKLNALKLELTDELDFGEQKVSRLVINGVTERKVKASIAVYLDNNATPEATFALPKQNKKGTWTVNKNMCVDLSALNLTGKHKVGFGLVYDESLGSTSASVLLRSVFFTANTVPVVDVNIDESDGSIAEMNNDTDHKTECYGNITVNVPDGYKSEYSDKTYTTGTYELEYIRGRGNSTWGTPKLPYKFKLEKKQDFFGMGANKHWILLANYYDYTMLRNKYTYWLGEKMGMEFTPQCVFIDLVMNGQYLGSYYLCEQIRIGKSRVDIDDLEDTPELSEGDDISGGYLLSLGEESGEYRMITTDNQSFLLENPDFSEYTNEAQYNYISNYLKKTEEAIYSKDFRDSEGKHYSEYIDVDAAIDYYLVQEFSLNGDAFGSGSTYLYKKRGGKLYWGPLWDFDYVAWGATEFDGNYTDGTCCQSTPWFNKLFSDPEFFAKFKKRWAEVKTILEDSIKDDGKLKAYAKSLYYSQKANYYATKTIHDESYYPYGDYAVVNNKAKADYDVISPTYGGDYTPVDVNFDSEVERLKNWISERITWFDENIDEFLTPVYNVNFKVDNKLYNQTTCTNDDLLSNLPAQPTKKGYTFVNWYTKDNGYEECIDSYVFDKVNTTVNFYAKWKKVSESSSAQKIAFPYKNLYLYGNYYSNFDDYDSYEIPISIMPFNADKSKISWKVSDNSVAKITSDGYITPLVVEGEVKVTATLGKKKATCTIIIGDYDDNDVKTKIEKASISVTKGKYSQVKLNKPPKSLWALSDIQFTSTNKKVVTVDKNGFIYGKKAGTAFVIVTNYGSHTPLICQIKVNPVPLKKGDKVTVGGLNYKITSVSKTRTVTVTGAKSKTAKTIKIPATIKAQGKKYKVTAIAAKAFNKLKKLTKVTIASKTIKKIGKAAFPKSKKIKYSLPKAKKKAYRKLLTKSGANV